jgi:hypothetical protein
MKIFPFVFEMLFTGNIAAQKSPTTINEFAVKGTRCQCIVFI